MVDLYEHARSEAAEVRLEIESGTAWIELNRPGKLNAVTNAMAADLARLCSELETDRSVQIIVISGRGRGFCAGADRDERLKCLAVDIDPYAAGSFVVAFHRLSKPVVAMVNGVAAGSGLALALAADIRVLSETAYFIPAFIARGLVPDSGLTSTLISLLGYGLAAEMLFCNQKVDAQQAIRMGLANHCVPLSELRSTTSAIASQLAGFDDHALRTTKQLLRMAAQPAFDHQAALEAFAQFHYLQRTNEPRVPGDRPTV